MLTEIMTTPAPTLLSLLAALAAVPGRPLAAEEIDSSAGQKTRTFNISRCRCQFYTSRRHGVAFMDVHGIQDRQLDRHSWTDLSKKRQRMGRSVHECLGLFLTRQLRDLEPKHLPVFVQQANLLLQPPDVHLQPMLSTVSLLAPSPLPRRKKDLAGHYQVRFFNHFQFVFFCLKKYPFLKIIRPKMPK